MKPLFRKGNYVKVTVPGCSYSFYKDMADKMKLKNFRFAKRPPIDVLYKIVSTRKHPQDGGHLYGIQNKETGDEFIVGQTGIVRNEKPESELELAIAEAVLQLRKNRA